MHSKVELGIIIFYSSNKPLYLNTRFKFFPDLTFQSFLRTFSWFHFTTRELPTIFHIAISTLCCEDTTFRIVNDCCYYFYRLHISQKPNDFKYSYVPS